MLPSWNRSQNQYNTQIYRLKLNPTQRVKSSASVNATTDGELPPFLRETESYSLMPVTTQPQTVYDQHS
jgi:hypothetical protein